MLILPFLIPCILRSHPVLFLWAFPLCSLLLDDGFKLLLFFSHVLHTVALLLQALEPFGGMLRIHFFDHLRMLHHSSYYKINQIKTINKMGKLF